MSKILRKHIYLFTPDKSFMQRQKLEIPRQSVTKVNAAKRSPCEFSVFFFPIIYFWANTSPAERVLNIKGT